MNWCVVWIAIVVNISNPSDWKQSSKLSGMTVLHAPKFIALNTSAVESPSWGLNTCTSTSSLLGNAGKLSTISPLPVQYAVCSWRTPPLSYWNNTSISRLLSLYLPPTKRKMKYLSQYLPTKSTCLGTSQDNHIEHWNHASQWLHCCYHHQVQLAWGQFCLSIHESTASCWFSFASNLTLSLLSCSYPHLVTNQNTT